MSEFTKLRARKAACSRFHGPEDPRTVKAAAALTWAHVLEDVRDWGPLSPEQAAEVVRIVYAVAGKAAP